MKPPRKRQLVDEVRAVWRVSRRAREALPVDRSTYHSRSKGEAAPATPTPRLSNTPPGLPGYRGTALASPNPKWKAIRTRRAHYVRHSRGAIICCSV
jgi:hypothetical protein